MADGILVIRGGAVGDFILTLPSIGLLRTAFPDQRLEILGYRQIAALAERRFYADAVRSIEYGPMARFFSREGELDDALAAYFAGFGQVVSYLSDPQGVFEGNLRRAGVRSLISAYRPWRGDEHAACQLAKPLEQMALFLEDPAARVFPTREDSEQAARHLLRSGVRVALHPGSGSQRKNWMLGRWKEVVQRLAERIPDLDLLLVGGEADLEQLDEFTRDLDLPVQRLENLPLPELAAVLQQCQLFLGHDSGPSHLAAAVGTRCVLLYGPTDPRVWAPTNSGVRVLEAPHGDFSRLHVEPVLRTAFEALEAMKA
jgi:heptosyltransferase-3